MNSMKVVAISDVHVKAPHDDADRLLSRFLKHPLVASADYIVLLGDIFDLMCGPHKPYLHDYSHLFDLMEQHRRNGKRVLFFEGNHDVHLEKLFRFRWPNSEIKPMQLPLIETIDGKTYYFSHGDEHEVDNVKYQKYKNLITSPALRFVANYVMPYWLLNFLGERASKMSRKRGAKEYKEDVVKERFRQGVKIMTSGNYNFILGGHSHVKDVFEINESSKYVNNGYALKTKSFILIDDHQISFPELT
jgi:UDP-2,3-diacylglucosamine hydrolase